MFPTGSAIAPPRSGMNPRRSFAEFPHIPHPDARNMTFYRGLENMNPSYIHTSLF